MIQRWRPDRGAGGEPLRFYFGHEEEKRGSPWFHLVFIHKGRLRKTRQLTDVHESKAQNEVGHLLGAGPPRESFRDAQLHIHGPTGPPGNTEQRPDATKAFMQTLHSAVILSLSLVDDRLVFKLGYIWTTFVVMLVHANSAGACSSFLSESVPGET